KGDRGAARGYYAELVKSSGVQSKYYQPSLQRLVEIAIAEKDVAGGEEAIRQLDGISAGLKQPSVPYVRGKFAFATGKPDDALELLEKSEPNTTKTPTVRILEGNLRIRKAQMIRQSQIVGTINPHESSDPATEYDKAARLFADTHDQYLPSQLALQQMVQGNL